MGRRAWRRLWFRGQVKSSGVETNLGPGRPQAQENLMKTSRMTAWFLVLCVSSWCRGGADEVPWGLYSMTWEGPGQPMKRADDSEGQVYLGKQLTPKLRDAALVSVQNDNSLYRLTIAADEFPDGKDIGQM